MARAVTTLNRSTTLTVRENNLNTHTVATWKIQSKLKVKISEPIIVEVMPLLSDGTTIASHLLFAFATFTSPGPKIKSFRVPLADDGQNYDRTPNDGWFTAGIYIPKLTDTFSDEFSVIGEWTVRLIAQDVNDAEDTMPAEEAAQHIGGIPILTPYTLERSSEATTSCSTAAGIVKILVEI